MPKTAQDIMQLIQEQGIKMVDFKMVDINGQYRHVTIPAENFSEETMKSGISGKRFVKDYGNFRDMESFDDLMKAWDGAIRELTRASVIVENAIDLASEREVPDILCSCLTQDCLGRGKTIKEGGAVYDFISGLQVGIANMADSLSAIKKLVYEEKKISKDELMNALATDFAGEEGERIRQMLINDAPKYGNDDDYVDQLVVNAYASYLDEVSPSTFPVFIKFFTILSSREW